MKYNKAALTLIMGMFISTGCADKSDSEDSGSDDAGTEIESDTGGEADDSDATSIPDPGTDYAPLRWYDDGGYHGTPDTAQVMGIVLDTPTYIQGGIDPDTGNHYFVFRTFEDQTSFSVDLFNKTSNIEHVEIYDGTGLVFGDKVEPTSVTSAVEVEWDLEADTIYVMEVHSPTGGFF